jgi:hypothetical protein
VDRSCCSGSGANKQHSCRFTCSARVKRHRVAARTPTPCCACACALKLSASCCPTSLSATPLPTACMSISVVAKRTAPVKTSPAVERSDSQAECSRAPRHIRQTDLFDRSIRLIRRLCKDSLQRPSHNVEGLLPKAILRQHPGLHQTLTTLSRCHTHSTTDMCEVQQGPRQQGNNARHVKSSRDGDNSPSSSLHYMHDEQNCFATTDALQAAESKHDSSLLLRTKKLRSERATSRRVLPLWSLNVKSATPFTHAKCCRSCMHGFACVQTDGVIAQTA